LPKLKNHNVDFGAKKHVTSNDVSDEPKRASYFDKTSNSVFFDKDDAITTMVSGASNTFFAHKVPPTQSHVFSMDNRRSSNNNDTRQIIKKM